MSQCLPFPHCTTPRRMPTALQNLETSRDQIATKIAEITANPKPTYSIDGQSVSHAEYLANLVEQFDKLLVLIGKLNPYVHKSQVL